MKTHRKFTPAKIPRYLPGQVADNYLQDDLSSFNIHRLRVFNAKPLVDCRPPKLNPFTCLNRKRMLEDALRCRRIDKDNKELLKKITTINRVGGRIDSYNPQAYRRINKWSAYNRDMEKLDLKNFALFQLLKDPVSVLSMKRVGWAENNSQFCITFKKMERLDHKNVVFGNVIKGNDVLMNIQYYGRKIGKPLEAIIISDCGECDVAAE
ncbi:hypothetical protein YQE_04912, partial [Dendroctonus ponderosae]